MTEGRAKLNAGAVAEAGIHPESVEDFAQWAPRGTQRTQWLARYQENLYCLAHHDAGWIPASAGMTERCFADVDGRTRIYDLVYEKAGPPPVTVRVESKSWEDLDDIILNDGRRISGFASRLLGSFGGKTDLDDHLDTGWQLHADLKSVIKKYLEAGNNLDAIDKQWLFNKKANASKLPEAKKMIIYYLKHPGNQKRFFNELGIPRLKEDGPTADTLREEFLKDDFNKVLDKLLSDGG